MSLWTKIVCLVSTVSLFALPAASHANPRTTAEVLESNLQAFCPGGPGVPGDAVSIQENFHRSALRITGDNLGGPPTTTLGAENIGAEFQGLFDLLSSFGSDACGLVVFQQVIDGEYAYIQWVWPNAGGLAPGLDAYGTDTLLVKGGQIRLQTVFIFYAPAAP